MANAFIQAAPDSTGKKLQTFRNTVGADSVDAEAVVLVDTTGAAISPALDATLTSGVQKAIARGGAKGTTAAADITSTPSGANHQGVDVVLYDAAGNLIDPRVIRALTSADVVTTVPPANASTNVAQLAGTTADTNSGLKSAGTLRVVLATDQPALTNKLLVTPDSVALPANQSVNVAQIAGAATAVGHGTAAAALRVELPTDGTGTVGLIAGSAIIGKVGIDQTTPGTTNNVAVTPPTLTKGTQAATGFSTQDLKDSGRVNVMWTAEVAGAATTEGLLTVTESRDGAATTTFTSKVVTNGKRLRITSLQIAIETLGTGTAPQRVYLRMRFNTAGAVTTASPLQGTWECVNNAAIVKSGATFIADFPDGIEYAGDGTKQIGFTIQFPDWVTTTATVQAKITVFGFEY